MSRHTESSPIGVTDCTFCGAKVVVRKSLKTGKAYWTCDGDRDVRACHSQVRLGPRPSRDLLEKHAKHAAPASPDAGTTPAQSAKLRSEARPAAPTASPPAKNSTPRPAPAERNPFDVRGNLFPWTRRASTT